MEKDIEPKVSEYYSYPPYPEPIENRPVYPEVLFQIIDKADQLKGQAFIAVDIDSTIYDNRPREARIIREFGQAHNIPALTICTPNHIKDRSLVRTMIQCGLSKEEAEGLDKQIRAFWVDRFFLNSYCAEDRPIKGASNFLNKIQSIGVRIFYCTGRPKDMEEGTLFCFKRDGFPMPDGHQTFLYMKPTFYMSDDDSKTLFYEKLKHQGTMLAAFDNEPLHINGYHQKYPEAIAVHLLTEESGRGIKVLPTIPSIRDFYINIT